MPLIVFGVFLVVVTFLVSRSGMGRNALLARGTLARGLVLSASRIATEATLGGQRFELRSVHMDVEVPGQQPYEVRTGILVPRICEALPGSSLELRVDPKNKNNIVVVGPPGASDWLPAGSSIPGQTWAIGGARRIGGPGRVMLVVIGVLLIAGGAGFQSAASKHETPRREPHATVPTHAALGPTCMAMRRCCEVMGGRGCSVEGLGERQCAEALPTMRQSAHRMGKHCP